MGKSLRLERPAFDQARGPLDNDCSPLFTSHGAASGISNDCKSIKNEIAPSMKCHLYPSATGVRCAIVHANRADTTSMLHEYRGEKTICYDTTRYALKVVGNSTSPPDALQLIPCPTRAKTGPYLRRGPISRWLRVCWRQYALT